MATLRGQDGTFDQKYTPLIKPLYNAIFVKLGKIDIDQEVKTRSIIAAADLVSVCSSILTPDEISKIIQLLTDKLKHDLTRDSALKGITLVALNETSDKT